MIAVIFEVLPHAEHRQAYLDTAADLRPYLETIDGFVSIERFESLSQAGKVLSLSFWRDEAAVQQWRNLEAHRQAQTAGRDHIFADYRLRVADVLRDYGLCEREQAPADSRQIHGGYQPTSSIASNQLSQSPPASAPPPSSHEPASLTPKSAPPMSGLLLAMGW